MARTRGRNSEGRPGEGPGAAEPREAADGPEAPSGGADGRAGALRSKGTPAGRRRKPPSRAVEDYLKAIYKLQQATSPVSTSALADELGRSAASVTNMVQGLAERGLVRYVPYHGVALSAGGELAALKIIRRHRVLELYLIEKLGFRWDDVHDEAERLEHAASDVLIDRMARALGEPSFDPHGSPIPTREGEIAEPDLTCLSELSPGTAGVVREVSDESAEGLRRLASLGLFPGTELRVAGREGGAGQEGEEEGMLRIDVEGRTVRLETRLAKAISVEVT